MSIIEDLIITLMLSKRAQLAILLGLVMFLLILLIGHHVANSLHFEGHLSLIAEIIRPVVQFRYEHAAWGVLITFWVLAGKIIIKDRKKYLY